MPNSAAFGCARADQGRQLIDKQNDLPGGIFDLFQHGLEPVFEFPAIFGPSEHGAQIEGDHAFVLQCLRNVAGDDALGQAFHDGGLAHTRLADEHGIILGAAGENLNHPANFFVTSDDRVKLAAAGQLGEITGVALQRLVLGFRILVGNFL